MELLSCEWGLKQEKSSLPSPPPHPAPLLWRKSVQPPAWSLLSLSLSVFVFTVALKRMLNFNAPPPKNTAAEPVWKVKESKSARTNRHTHTHTQSITEIELRWRDVTSLWWRTPLTHCVFVLFPSYPGANIRPLWPGHHLSSAVCQRAERHGHHAAPVRDAHVHHGKTNAFLFFIPIHPCTGLTKPALLSLILSRLFWLFCFNHQAAKIKSPQPRKIDFKKLIQTHSSHLQQWQFSHGCTISIHIHSHHFLMFFFFDTVFSLQFVLHVLKVQPCQWRFSAFSVWSWLLMITACPCVL